MKGYKKVQIYRFRFGTTLTLTINQLLALIRINYYDKGGKMIYC